MERGREGGRPLSSLLSSLQPQLASSPAARLSFLLSVSSRSMLKAKEAMASSPLLSLLLRKREELGGSCIENTVAFLGLGLHGKQTEKLPSTNLLCIRRRQRATLLSCLLLLLLLPSASS
jgi:hypothetical protein